jgi:hypothetical protein
VNLQKCLGGIKGEEEAKEESMKNLPFPYNIFTTY